MILLIFKQGLVTAKLEFATSIHIFTKFPYIKTVFKYMGIETIRDKNSHKTVCALFHLQIIDITCPVYLISLIILKIVYDEL